MCHRLQFEAGLAVRAQSQRLKLVYFSAYK